MTDIFIDAEKAAEKDPAFFKRLKKEKKSAGRGSSPDNGFRLRKTLAEIILEESGYEVMAPVSFGAALDINADNIPIRDAYDLIKTPKLSFEDCAIEQETPFAAKATPDKDSNPDAFECYKTFQVISSYLDEKEQEIFKRRSEIKKHEKTAKDNSLAIEEAQGKIMQREETILRRNYGMPAHKRKPTEPLEKEISQIKSERSTAERAREENLESIKSDEIEIVKIAAEMEATTSIMLKKLHEKAKEAGLESLAQKSFEAYSRRAEKQQILKKAKFRALVGGFDSKYAKFAEKAIERHLASETHPQLEKAERMFKEFTEYDMTCIIEPPKKRRWLGRKTVGIIGAASVIVIGGMAYLFTGGLFAEGEAKTKAENKDEYGIALNDAPNRHTAKTKMPYISKRSPETISNLERVRDDNTGDYSAALTVPISSDFRGVHEYTVRKHTTMDVQLWHDKCHISEKSLDRRVWVLLKEQQNKHPKLLELDAKEDERKITTIWPNLAPGKYTFAVVAKDEKGRNEIQQYSLKIDENMQKSVAFLGTKWRWLDKESNMWLTKWTKDFEGLDSAFFEPGELAEADLGISMLPMPQYEEPVYMNITVNTVPPGKSEGRLAFLVDKERNAVIPIPPRKSGIFSVQIKPEDYAGNMAKPVGCLMAVRNEDGELWYAGRPGHPRMQSLEGIAVSENEIKVEYWPAATGSEETCLGYLISVQPPGMKLSMIIPFAEKHKKMIMPNELPPGAYDFKATNSNGESYSFMAFKFPNGCAAWQYPPEKETGRDSNPLKNITIHTFHTGKEPVVEYRRAYSNKGNWAMLEISEDGRTPIFPELAAPGLYDIRLKSGPDITGISNFQVLYRGNGKFDVIPVPDAFLR